VLPASLTTFTEVFATVFVPSYVFCTIVLEAFPTFAMGLGIAFTLKLFDIMTVNASQNQMGLCDLKDILILSSAATGTWPVAGDLCY
jgi:hypothetical protein